MDLEKIFSRTSIAAYLKKREQKPFLGQTLFPEEKVQDIDIEYLKGGGNLPVSASVHAFESKTEIDTRDSLELVRHSLALIKRQTRLSEKLIIKLEAARNDAEQKKAIEEVFNDAEKMVLAVKTRIEAMRMEVLATGKITVLENNLNITLDYNMPPENMISLAGTSLWTDPGSDPVKDIMDFAEKLINSSGSTPTRILTSNKVLMSLLRNEKVKKDILGNTGKLLAKKDLNSFLESNSLPTIATYDERYRKQQKDGSYISLRFFPEDRFVMMPDGELGKTIYGLTAEEIELKDQNDIKTAQDGFIFVETYKSADPVARFVKAVATALPAFPAADEVFTAKVI